MEHSTSPQKTEKGVLAVLAGVPLQQAAVQVPMEPDDLADAVELYQAAGYAALEAQADPHGWYQVRLQFADWETAEQTAVAYLRPELRQAETAGIVAQWWFIRKAPCWRLRCRPSPATTPADMKAFLGHALDGMLSSGVAERWWKSIYEPETAAFGGQQGMDVAHRIFHADSRGILDYLSRHDPAAPPNRRIDRRELSVLLCSILMHAAGQEWYERGDIWHRLEKHRPLNPGTPLDRLRAMKPAIQHLMTVDTGPTSKLMKKDGPLAPISDWAAAMDEAGKALDDHARDGKLSRGVRDILTHHVIFHWNRMGLSLTTQSILARAAREVVLGE